MKKLIFLILNLNFLLIANTQFKCGYKNLDKRYLGANTEYRFGYWKDGVINYIYSPLNAPNYINSQNFLSSIQIAMQEWSVSNIKFNYIGSLNIDINQYYLDFNYNTLPLNTLIIGWKNDHNIEGYDGTGQILGYYNNLNIKYGILSLNNTLTSISKELLLHELGHILGLGHSDVKHSIMFSYEKYNIKIGLQDDDKQGIQEIYGVKNEKYEINPSSSLDPAPTANILFSKIEGFEPFTLDINITNLKDDNPFNKEINTTIYIVNALNNNYSDFFNVLNKTVELKEGKYIVYINLDDGKGRYNDTLEGSVSGNGVRKLYRQEINVKKPLLKIIPSKPNLKIDEEFTITFNDEYKNSYLNLSCKFENNILKNGNLITHSYTKEGNYNIECSAKELGKQELTYQTIYLNITNEIGNYKFSQYDKKIIIKDNLAYIIDDTHLKIIDITDKTKLILKSLYYTNNIENLFISEEYNLAYLACGEYGVEVIDISNKSNPKLIEKIDTNGYVYDLFLKNNNNKLHIADGRDGLKIFKTDYGKNLTLENSFKTDGIVKDIDVYGNFAYIADSFKGIKIINVGYEIPQLINKFMTDKSDYLLFDGIYLYVADRNELKIIDVTNIKNLMLKSYIKISDYYNEITDLFLQNNYIYVINLNGITVINVTDKSNPKIEKTINLNNATDIFIDKNYAFVTSKNEKNFKIIDLSTDNFIEYNLSSNFNLVNNFKDIYVYKDKIYVSSENNSIKIFDDANKSKIKLINELEIDGEIDKFIEKNNDLHAIINKNSNLINISDETNLSEINIPNKNIKDIIFEDKYIFLINESGILEIRDYDNNLINEIDEIWDSSLSEGIINITSFYIDENTLYLIINNQIIKILNISCINNIIEIGEIDSIFQNKNIFSNIEKIYVKDNYLYLIDDYKNLFIYNISNIKNPLLIKEMNNIENIFIKNSYLYTINQDELTIYDLSNILNIDKKENNNKITYCLNIKEGWNLVSIPINENVNRSSFKSISEIFSFRNGKWMEDIPYIQGGEGVWIKSNKDINLTFNGNVYVPNLKNLTSKWNLMGTGILLKKLSQYQVFTYKNNSWLKNPNKIESGDGFWIKK